MTRDPSRVSLRLRVLVALARRLAKPRTLPPPDPIATRAFVNRFVLPALLLGARVEPGRVGGVPGEWSRARGRDGAHASRGGPRTLVYLHGGAYAVCSPQTHRPITAAFARRGFAVFAPAYRLAPEHPFPAALEDAVATCRALLEGGTAPDRLVVAGDSAGGGLALATLLRLRDLGLPLPAAAALFSPWTDLACTGGTMRSNAERDPLFHPARADEVAAIYLGAADARDPLASPLHGDLAGLPPLLIQVGESEILRDDSVRVAQRVQEAGGSAVLERWPVVPHGWQLLAGVLPEARRAVDRAAAFLHGETEASSVRGRHRASGPSLAFEPAREEAR